MKFQIGQKLRVITNDTSKKIKDINGKIRYLKKDDVITIVQIDELAKRIFFEITPGGPVDYICPSLVESMRCRCDNKTLWIHGCQCGVII